MRHVASVLCGLSAAGSVFFVDGQQVTAKIHEVAAEAEEHRVPVGFVMEMPSGDADDLEGEELVVALESDSLLLADNVERGQLVCETLDEAEDAKVLSFTLGIDEGVIADKIDFKILGKEEFSDDLPRNVWIGSVREESDYDGYPREISMLWTGCSIENFQVKMIAPSTGGGVDTTMSHPSRGNTGGFLVAHVHLTPTDESDVHVDNDGRRLDTLTARRALAQEAKRGVEAARLEDPDIDAKDSDIGLLQAYRSASPQEKEAFHESGLRRLSEDKVVMPGGRVLEDSKKPVIDVLVLYTPSAMQDSKSSAGAERSNSQMETDIAASYEGANRALADSGVEFTIRVVHMMEVDYEESDDIVDAVYDLQKNENFKADDVHVLRDKYGADLVQLVGFYDRTCGIGFTMSSPSSGFSKYGYSVVHTNCLSNFSHIHELGHNLGANHDRANAQSSHSYSYAYRKCDGTKPFRTIMAYSTGCSGAPRVNVFSNPDKTYNGQPQGTEEENNARVLNEAMSTVVNFRESVVPSPSPAPVPKRVAPPTPKPVADSPPSPMPAPSPGTPTYPPPLTNKRMVRKGCYKDDPASRVMKAKTKSSGMTPEICMSYCFNHQKNFHYFGLEFGEECFCRGNKKKWSKNEIDNSKCEMECAGDSSETCGGRRAIEVFRIKDKKTNADSDTLNYQGCYKDVKTTRKGQQRRMAEKQWMRYKHTSLEGCKAHCSGFSYYALKFGFMCSCGDTLPDERAKVADTQCSTPCSSPEDDNNCGGHRHQAIFSMAQVV